MMVKNYWSVFAWSIIILILTGIPGSALPKVGNLWDWIRPDKMAHFFLFAIFLYLLIKSRARHLQPKKLPIKNILLLFLVGIVFASLTEILQEKLFINRNGNLYDFVADAIGCLAGMAIYLIAAKKKMLK